MRPHQESLAVISRYVSGMALCQRPWRFEARSHGRVCAALPSSKLLYLPSHACVGVRFVRALQMHGDAIFALVAKTTGVTQVRILGALNPLGSRVIQGGLVLMFIEDTSVIPGTGAVVARVGALAATRSRWRRR